MRLWSAWKTNEIRCNKHFKNEIREEATKAKYERINEKQERKAVNMEEELVNRDKELLPMVCRTNDTTLLMRRNIHDTLSPELHRSSIFRGDLVIVTDGPKWSIDDPFKYKRTR